ncbi:thiamine pyrophosphate-binding protein [Microbacterium sp. cf332]|uniref:thiamine pyrophosphate-binding protein n=1 Tax=Microbacterium sp. cf332 TaxID=1761804 RepID=UPI0008911257|nr:thiamine pyrophosphate-binding protein [Microbacterium sp. cf332]SDQ57888.1 acetolactate synthase-1/2/3 large subunit [Microbacterium sp. cf332]
MTHERTGGDVAVETLRALGVDRLVGIPGQHALGLFDALRRAPIELLPARVENNAGFMADGLARVGGGVAPLLLSTGPGALTALPALMEAAGSSIPVLAISAQIPVDGLGGARRGHLHELDDQSAAFAQVVKGSWTVRNAAQIPSALIEAWELAASVPQGPVLVEIPQDVLLAPVGDDVPPVEHVEIAPRIPRVRDELVARAAIELDDAERPVILAGGGAARAAAGGELMRVAEALDAPVFSTFSGRDAVPAGHPLAAGAWIEDIATTEYLESADVLLVVGSALGEVSSNYFTLRPGGRLVQLDAELRVIGSNHAGLGLHCDARDALERIAAALESTSDPERRARRIAEVAEVAATVRARIDGQGFELERGILASIREALPDDADSFWDMTMIAYWAWSAWDGRAGRFATAQGAGGLGYGFPAAVGAAFADRSRPVLAVSGDGGAMYGLGEIATCLQLGLDVTWLIVADGGYGILAEYMNGAFGAATATDLVMPDFVALARSFGAHAVQTTPTALAADLREALATPGPSVVLLPQAIGLFAPTHRDREAS